MPHKREIWEGESMILFEHKKGQPEAHLLQERTSWNQVSRASGVFSVSARSANGAYTTKPGEVSRNFEGDEKYREKEGETSRSVKPSSELRKRIAWRTNCATNR